MARRRDSLTLDLFDAPAPPRTNDGALNHSLELRALLSRLLKNTPLDRFEVAARMSALLGVEVTKFQLDSWTAESRDGWRFPLEYAVAFEVALNTHELTRWYAERRGCRVLVGQEALLAELGRLDKLETEIKAERDRINAELQSKQ